LEKCECILGYDKVCIHLHYSIYNKLGIETAENWYSHLPKAVCDHENTRMRWNQVVQTGSGQ